LVSYEEGPSLLRTLVGAKVPPAKMLGLDAFFVPRLAQIVDSSNPATLNGFSVFGTPGDNAFLARLAQDDPNGQAAYAAQAYDCAVILSLAADQVKSNKAETMATAIQGVTAGGRTCTTYADCAAKATAGEDIDYDGVTGKLAINDKGDPTFSRFTTATWQ